MLKKLLFCSFLAIASAFAQAPNVGTISPAGGSGPGASFTFTVTDPYGIGDISQVLVVIEPAGTSPGSPVSNACYITYVQNPWWGAFLWNDAGTTAVNYGPDGAYWAGSGTNSHCGLSAGWGHTVNGNTLSFTLPVTFKSLSGPLTIYTSVSSNAFGASAWEPWNGIWTAGPNGTPTMSFSGPSQGSGFVGSFSASSTDSAGASDIAWIETYASGLPSGLTCTLLFMGGNGYLANDAVTSWGSPVSPNGSGSVSNTACTLQSPSYGQTSNGVNYGFTVSMNPAVPGGTYRFYAIASNVVGTYSPGGWQPSGTWTVPVLPVLPAVITSGPEIQQPPAYDQYTGTMLTPPTNTTTGLQLVRATTAPDYGSVVHNSDTFTAQIVGAPAGSTVFVTVVPSDQYHNTSCVVDPTTSMCTPALTDVNWCGIRPSVYSNMWSFCGAPTAQQTGIVGTDGTFTMSGSFANMRATEWTEDWLVVFSTDGVGRHLGAAYFIQ